MARVAEATRVAVASSEVDRGERAGARFAWLTLLLAAWNVGALFFDLWALLNGLTRDPAAPPYSIPFYLGVLTLVVSCVTLVVRARRRGRTWRHAFPPGYGILGVGAVVLLVALVADLGWRGGVGIAPRGVEGYFAPSRVVLIVGLVLISVGPLRAALRSRDAFDRGWPAVLSAALVLTLASLPGGYHPAVSPWLEQWIRPASSEIWVMDGDGGHQTRLIEAGDGIEAWNPVWSPDGTKIAYSRMRLGDHPPVNTPDDSDIWIANADGTGGRPVVQREGWQWLPHWSPDGTWLVYTDEPEEGPWASAGPAGFFGPLGPGFGGGPPDPIRQPADIWRVRVDGTEEPERITDTPGDDRAAAFSPDGHRLVFDATRDGNTEVYVMETDGSNPRRLTTYSGDDWGAAWSPNGRQIAWNSDRTGEMQIYVMNADGSDQSVVTTDPGTHVGPSWSSDGSRIAFGSEQGDTCEIASVARDGSDLRDLTRSPGACEDLTSGGGDWGPNARIVYARGEDPPAIAAAQVREDLAAAAMLLTVVALALVAVILARIRPPFGAFASIMGISTAIFALTSDSGRFIPAAVVGGLLVDLLVRFASARWKAVVAGAGSGAAFVLGAGATVSVTGGLAWSPTLWLGVAVAGGAIGWGIAELAGLLSSDREHGAST
jgi:Tol biopolymer transport system component